MGQRPFIVLGDATDHGGVVVGATQVSLTHGKPIARVGDRVTCPRRGHGTTVIVTGDPTMIIDGSAAARHGDKCACGAILISSQFVSTVGDSGGAGTVTSHTHADDAVVAHVNSQVPTDEDEEVLEQFYEILDADGQPVEGYKFDLFANDVLHTKAARLTSARSAVVDGEGSAANDRDEIFALASVLVRQRNAREYSTMSAFIKGEPSYSYVIGDGNPRYNKMSKASDAAIRKDSGMSLAIEAAENAMKSGPDLSNGAYFWDGGDIKTNYAKHFKVKHGIKFTAPAHNVYDIKESTKLVVLTRTVKKRVGKKVTTTKEEIGRYDHVYESTAGHGGTIFWKNGADYLSTAGAKQYK